MNKFLLWRKSTRRSLSVAAGGSLQRRSRDEPYRSSHKCIEMDGTGRLRLGRMSIRRLRERTHAPLRDLLQLGLSSSSIDNQGLACVLPRPRATLVHFGGLKAIIGARSAIFFDAELPSTRRIVRRIAESDICTPSSFINGDITKNTATTKTRSAQNYDTKENEGEEEEAETKKEDECEKEDQLPFELAVLEGILREACGGYQRRLRLYEKAVQRSIDKLMDSSAEDGFIDDVHRLGALESALLSFAAETEAAVRVLVDLLASDEDMVNLLVSERERERNETNYTINVAERHDVVELLLESYHRRLAHVGAILNDLKAQLTASRDLAKVAIDVRRNNIIRFNLYLSTSSLGLAVTTCATSIFGMNLKSGLEESDGLFLPVSLFSGILGLAIAIFGATALHGLVRVDMKHTAGAVYHTGDRLHLAHLFKDVSHLDLPRNLQEDFATSTTAPTSASSLDTLSTIRDWLNQQRKDVMSGTGTGARSKNGRGSTFHLTHFLNRQDLSTLLLATNGRSPSKPDLDLIFDIFDPQCTGKIHITRLADALSADKSAVNNNEHRHNGALKSMSRRRK